MYNLKFPREVCNPKRQVVVNKEQYLNRKCVVIANEKDKVRIDYLLKQGSTVKVVGNREIPYSNKISDILKITTMRAARR